MQIPECVLKGDPPSLPPEPALSVSIQSHTPEGGGPYAVVVEVVDGDKAMAAALTLCLPDIWQISIHDKNGVHVWPASTWTGERIIVKSDRREMLGAEQERKAVAGILRDGIMRIAQRLHPELLAEIERLKHVAEKAYQDGYGDACMEQ